MVTQVFTFFVVNMLVTYGIDVFPKWYMLKRDKNSTVPWDGINTRKKTQIELEELYRCPKFDVNTRYIYFFITLLICMLFSGFTSSLYPAACLIFGIGLLNDKYLLLNFHPKSGSFDEFFHMSVFAAYVPMAGLMHAVVCIISFYLFNLQMKSLLEV